jgi:UDP-3-O-[3-hydroxymyristoyl] N-acetylglucosamine deacetylase
MKSHCQTTLETKTRLEGIGVHSGAKAVVTLHPAEPDSGRVFARTDTRSAPVPALAAHVTPSDLSTVLGDERNGGIATIEHLMAALNGLGIDNCRVEVDGPEMPILDGSAMPFVEAIREAGLSVQDAPRRFLKITKEVAINHGDSRLVMRPAESGFRMETGIDFSHPLIGRQSFALSLTPSTFANHLARARTFGFMADVERLWAMKRALGAGLDNTVVLAEDRIVNTEGLRFPDEFVRHKMLDAVGDLALAGAPIIGSFSSFKGGHRLNLAMVNAILADASAYEWVSFGDNRAQDGKPRRAGVSAMVAAAYSPDKG